MTSSVRRPYALALCGALVAALAATRVPASAQEPPPTDTSSTTSPTVTVPLGETTTTTEPPPEDPGAVEDLPEEPVPVVEDTVPPTPPGDGAYAAQAGQIFRQELRVAKAESIETDTAFSMAKQRVVDLETELDLLEVSVTHLAASDRAAVRRVELARRQFEARAANAVVRGSLNDFTRYISTDDPNELAVADALLDSVLSADQEAVVEYLAAKAEVDTELVRTAERLVTGRLELEAARVQMVEARRASVAALFNLAVFAAGSEIAIHGFVFPVGDPHSIGTPSVPPA